jgi:hypothetical protein
MTTYEDTLPLLRVGIYNFQASDPAEMASESPLCGKLWQMCDSKRVTMQQTSLLCDTRLHESPYSHRDAAVRTTCDTL